MISMSKSSQDSLQVGLQDSCQDSLQVGCQNSSTLTKRKETKRNITPPISPNCFEEFAGDNAELLSALQDCEVMRNKIKKPMTDRARPKGADCRAGAKHIKQLGGGISVEKLEEKCRKTERF